jgi:PAS domain-containing protein
VTDDRDAQEALRRIAKHLAAAQRITHCGSWELDLGDLGDINANSLRWSDEVFRIFGYEPGTIEVTNDSFFRRMVIAHNATARCAPRSSSVRRTPSIIAIRPDAQSRSFTSRRSSMAPPASRCA